MILLHTGKKRGGHGVVCARDRDGRAEHSRDSDHRLKREEGHSRQPMPRGAATGTTARQGQSRTSCGNPQF
eukprot:3637153-Rhodomonas_salina.1